MGYLVEIDGELSHHALDDIQDEEQILKKLAEHVREHKNGNILFYIHGMLAHTKWYQKMVHNKLNQGLYTDSLNKVNIIISLVWHGTMDYPQNYVDAYQIGESYFSFIEKAQAITKKHDKEREINFIMHSMGSRAFQGIYDKYINSTEKDWKAENLLFVASDAPDDCFYKEGVFSAIDSFANNIVVYKNVHDFTLGISRGINEQDRIGLSGISDMSKVSKAISVVDVSILNDNDGMMKLTGHRYLFESPSVRKDILKVLNLNIATSLDRNLVKDSVIMRTYTLK